MKYLLLICIVFAGCNYQHVDWYSIYKIPDKYKTGYDSVEIIFGPDDTIVNFCYPKRIEIDKKDTSDNWRFWLRVDSGTRIAFKQGYYIHDSYISDDSSNIFTDKKHIIITTNK